MFEAVALAWFGSGVFRQCTRRVRSVSFAASLFEADRLEKLRSAVIESLGMQENSDVREGWMHEVRGPYVGPASGGLRAWCCGRGRRQHGFRFVSALGSSWLSAFLALVAADSAGAWLLRDPQAASGPRRAQHTSRGACYGRPVGRRGPHLQGGKSERSACMAGRRGAVCSFLARKVSQCSVRWVPAAVRRAEGPFALLKCGVPSEVPLSATVFDGTQAEPLNPLAVVRRRVLLATPGDGKSWLRADSFDNRPCSAGQFVSSFRVSGRPTW